MCALATDQEEGRGGFSAEFRRGADRGNLLVKRSSSHHRIACTIARRSRFGIPPVPQITEDGLPIVPQERDQYRTRERIVDVLVPQIKEDGLHLVPQERDQNRTREQIVDVLVPQIVEERVHHRTQEQIADSLVPPIMEAVLPSTPQERVQNLTQEQVMDFPVPQNMGDYAGVVHATPLELVQNRSFVRQTTKEIGDGVQHVPSKHTPERHGDSNIKGLDKYNMPCAGVVSNMIPTDSVRVADVFRPLSHGRTRDVSVKKEIAVKKGPKRLFVDSAPPHSASKPYTGTVFTVEVPHQHVGCSTSRLSLTSTTCLVLETSW